MWPRFGHWFVFALYALAAFASPLRTCHGAEPVDSIINSIGIELKLIPAGEFVMGNSREEVDWVVRQWPHTERGWVEDAYPPHQVRITKPFYLGVHEVTVGQFRRFVEEDRYKTEAEKDGKGSPGWNEAEGKFEGYDRQYTWNNPGWSQTEAHPVVNVTWNDAVAFCKWLNQKVGGRYRLPTEAEWEYACRAGTTTRYYSGDDPAGLSQAANIADATADENRGVNTQIVSRDGFVFSSPVGRFEANAFGLYDMHGNVWEWCQDYYGNKYYNNSPLDDPHGPLQASLRVARGGSWLHNAGYCRAAYRNKRPPSFRRYYLGFRVALDPPSE